MFFLCCFMNVYTFNSIKWIRANTARRPCGDNIHLSIPLNGFVPLKVLLDASEMLALSIPLNGFSALQAFEAHVVHYYLSIPLNGFLGQPLHHKPGAGEASFNSIKWIR